MTERIIRIAGEQYRADVEQRIDELGGEIFGEYTEAVDGFAARLSSKAAFLLAETEGIEAIEENIELTMQTSAIRTDNFCTSNSLGKTDDGGTFPLALGFNVNWFGLTYNEILVNNNGGAAFNNDSGRFQDFTGINLTTTNRPLLLPLFTDIDTTNASASSVTFGSGTIAGENAYCVNWLNVGEFSSSLPKFSFQLVIIDKSGSGNAGDVDIEFNYSQVGIPTANTNGRFVIGYSVPHSRTDSLVRVSSSDTPSLFADGGALALTSNKYPSSGSIVGRYTFEIRPDSAGSAPTPDPIATPIASAGNCNGLSNPSTTLSGYANTYCDVVWGLDRIDQRPLPLNDEFSPDGDGTGVKAYVVDTGLKTDHQEFTGRVDTGRNFFGTDQNGDTSVADCNGHGTHVASTLAGSRYGVAKDATIVPVRVFGCSGGTTVATILNALDWIAANHPNATPGVVNMSLGGGANTTLDQAVQCLTGLGSGCTNNALTVVVAAGNSNTTASSVSPARVAEAITVGSTTSVDSRSGFSNYGSAVDIFAPGSGITAAWYTSTTATATISGTSMASPHVAGAAAVYLENNTSATPSQVLSALVDDATQNALTDIGSGSPNKLLFIGGLPIVTSVSPNSSAATSTASVTITGENLDNSSGNSVVEFGAGRAATWSSESDTQLVVTSPTGSAGAVDLIIDNGRGDQRIMNAFTYTSGNANAPTITAISPAEGPTGGGQTVTITGTNLEVNSENTSVSFGDAPAQVTSATTTQLQVRTPPGTAGNVIVSVTTSEGSSTSNYAYVAAPNITSLSTQSGPIAGGTQVTVTGSNLALTSSVTVGGVSATLGAVTASSVEFTTPQRPSATVNSYILELTTPGGTVTLPSAFTYVPAPSISSIASLGQLTGSSTTLSGPAAGGTGVRILGSNLGEVTAVRFGSTAATFTRESGSSIIAISPAGSGTVSITVVSPGGSATLANAFQYEAAQTGGVGGGVGGGGGAFIPPATGGGGGGGGADVKPTRPAVTSNQVDSPGRFRIVDDSGRGVRLNRAELSNTGLVIAGDEWSLSGSGPLTASSTDVAPGSMFTFAGEGLERLTTVGIYILSEPTWVASGIVGFDGKFQTSFAMPALEPGQHTLQVNAVLEDEIPVSIGVGFTLTGTTVPAKEAASPALESNSAADFVLFRGQSSALTRATRTKLTRLAQRFPTAESRVAIVAFTDSRGAPASKRRAQARAEEMQDFLQGAGFAGSIQIATEPGSTNLQSRGALVYVQPAGTSAVSVDADSVRSLIVRLKKGRSITVDGEVRGSGNVTGPIGDSLTVGPYLGLRMYRVDFAEPVSEKIAERVANQLAKDPGIEFAEPDSIVSTQVSLAS